jgi:hypothetical protein
LPTIHGKAGILELLRQEGSLIFANPGTTERADGALAADHYMLLRALPSEAAALAMSVATPRRAQASLS